MQTKKRGSGSRDLGLSHGAGKGDADRSNPKLFKARFPKMGGTVEGFQQQGRRLIKVYGPRGGDRPVSYHALPPGLGADFAVAQRIADETNAGFRARGIDTLGH